MSKIQLQAFVLVGLMALALICSKSMRSEARKGRVRTDFNAIPLTFHGWEGAELTFDQKTYELLPTCSLLLRDYVRKDEPAMVELAIVYGTDLGDFHQPEYCLEGQGLKRIRESNIRIGNGRGGLFNANSLIMNDQRGKHSAYIYWFYSRGMTGDYLGSMKVSELINRLRGERVEPSAMVRLATSVTDSDGKAVRRLTRFAEDMFPYLEAEFRTGESVK